MSEEQQIELWNKILKAAIHNDIDFIKNLKKFYPDMHWKHIRQPKTCDTALHYAAQSGFLELVKFLLTSFEPKEVDIRNNDQATPLHFAAQFSQHRVVAYLLSVGADVNALKRCDWSPTMLACTKTGDDAFLTVQHLCNHKPVLKQLNRDGFTALQLACREGDVAIIDLLLQTEPQVLLSITRTRRTCLHTACIHGQLKVVEDIFPRYNSELKVFNQKDSCGSTPFHDAVLSGNKDIVNYAVEKGADITLTNKEGWNALHICSNVGNSEMVKHLVNELKFDVNCLSVGKHAITPLHLAARSKYKETMDTLIELGADINILDWQGRTAHQYYTSTM